MSQVSPPDQDQVLKLLELRVEELIRLCSQLNDENQTLRHQYGVLLAERSKLTEKNELARTRIEAMISRLKNMEHNYG